MVRAENERYEIDPDDGMVREIVGEWAVEKHERLRRYIEITRETRRKFEKNRPAYIDLYCATGRAKIRNSDPPRVVDGSAIVAATTLAPPYGFNEIFLGDIEQSHLDACTARLHARGAPQTIHPLLGAAEKTAQQVVDRVNPYGLHLAFLDPYNLASLPFSVIKTLAKIKRMDLIIHLSENDLQRNVIGKKEFYRLDNFAPGWEKYVDTTQRAHIVKAQILQAWKACVQSLGYKVSDNIERVTGSQNQPLYWLLLAAKDDIRNDLANKFWGAISNVGPQVTFDF